MRRLVRCSEASSKKFTHCHQTLPLRGWLESSSEWCQEQLSCCIGDSSLPRSQSTEIRHRLSTILLCRSGFCSVRTRAAVGRMKRSFLVRDPAAAFEFQNRQQCLKGLLESSSRPSVSKDLFYEPFQCRCTKAWHANGVRQSFCGQVKDSSSATVL
jgi:hypothetical protein